MLPGLAELDLSGNLISSWAFVAELAAALPGLHTLNLSGNRLALPSLAGGGATTAAGTDSMAAGMGAPSAAAAGSHSSAAEHQQQAQGSSEGGSGSKLPMPAAAAYSLPAGQPTSLAGIRTLVLNGCGASWQQAVAIAQQLPNLRELHLCNNGMASLQMPGTSSSEAGGKGSSGGEGAVATLAGLSLSPSAGSCSSASHSLCSISQLLAAAFPQLEVLDLEGNALSSWTELATLSTLPRLRSLLLSGNRLDDVQYSGGGWEDAHFGGVGLASCVKTASRLCCLASPWGALGNRRPAWLLTSTAPSHCPLHLLPRPLLHRLHLAPLPAAGQQLLGRLGGGGRPQFLPRFGGSAAVGQPLDRRCAQLCSLPVHRAHPVGDICAFMVHSTLLGFPVHSSTRGWAMRLSQHVWMEAEVPAVPLPLHTPPCRPAGLEGSAHIWPSFFILQGPHHPERQRGQPRRALGCRAQLPSACNR